MGIHSTINLPEAYTDLDQTLNSADLILSDAVANATTLFHTPVVSSINGKEVVSRVMVLREFNLAKKKFMGQSVSLDSLCRKYDIDLTEREVHGALKDAKLLAAVYLELIGGKQTRLDFEKINDEINSEEEDYLFNLNGYYSKMSLKKIKHLNINKIDYELHSKSIETINNSIWKKISN